MEDAPIKRDAYLRALVREHLRTRAEEEALGQSTMRQVMQRGAEQPARTQQQARTNAPMQRVGPIISDSMGREDYQDAMEGYVPMTNSTEAMTGINVMPAEAMLGWPNIPNAAVAVRDQPSRVRDQLIRSRNARVRQGNRT